MNVYDQLALWYLRLNGYFTMPNFIAHGNEGPRTDVDVLGVRPAHSREYPDDIRRLQICPGKTDFVLAESTAGRCKLNGPWKVGGSRRALEYVLRRVGTFDSDDGVSAAATALYGKQRYENVGFVIRMICFGSQSNGRLHAVTQILWPDALSFINQRFQTYKAEKADHQHWDAFGKYLWNRLSVDAVPAVTDLVKGWEGKCPCWP